MTSAAHPATSAAALPPEDARREAQRLEALERLDILDTPGEEAFDRITRLVCRMFHVPMSTVTLIDGHRQWFKSRQGLVEAEGARGPALCNYAIRNPGPMVVPDTLADARFEHNPLVTGDPGIRFYAGVPLRTDDGHAIGTLCAMDTEPRVFDPEQVGLLCDMARLIMGEMKLRMLASIDGLTGALSRRAFREEAGRAVSLAERHRHPLSLIAFDLDHFKRVNDTHGHAAGDAVLAGAAEACQALLRKTDLFGRMGGEEFAILLPHTGRTDALAVAEKLRGAIRAERFAGPEGVFTVTASLGIATHGRASPDLDTLLKQADSALYEAKQAGRDRCTAFRPTENEPPAGGRRVLKAGQIVFNGGHSIIDCTVRRLSDTGAMIEVTSSAGVPDRFKLRIEADDFSRLCDIKAKSEKAIEIAFG